MYEFFKKNSVKGAIAPQSHLPSAFKFLFIGLLLLVMLGSVHADLTDDLISYYKLDETTGDVIDSHGSNDGTNNGATRGATGKIENAFDFDGSGDYVNTNMSGNGFNTGSFSVWAKSSNVTDYKVIIGKEFSDDGFDLSFNSSKAVLKYGNQFVEGDTTISTNTWYHIVGIATSTNILIYLNGNLDKNVSKTGTASSTQNYYIGNRLRAGGDFLGTIDEIGIWSRALTSDEITELYNSGSGLTYPFDVNAVYADFDYVVDGLDVDLNDTSIVSGDAVIGSWEWLIDDVSVSTDQNYSFIGTPNIDQNVCLIIQDTTLSLTSSICQNIFIEYGNLRLNFYDDTSETDLNEVYFEFDGTPYYSDENNFININLNGITSGYHTILLQRTGYQEKDFELYLTEFSDLNYNIGFIESTSISEVDFQVFTSTGSSKPNTIFMVTDNDNNYLIDVKTTDSLGRVTFILNNQKSEYSFTSTDFNFGVTEWIINKPKDAITLVNIAGDWKYSITGNSYSSATNIVAGVTKLLLQNTVNPYYIKIQDVAETYAQVTFGLKSITGEDTKTLNPYLYPIGSADLKLIKLLDYTTNQPIARSIELDLSVYTDSNGLIPIGTFLNDSTGTYNIYMDSNENYRLEIEDQLFELRPTLEVYYIYLSTSIGLVDPTSPIDVNIPVSDFNFPTETFTQVSDYLFGCNINDDSECYTPMIFSLIVIVLLLIVFVAYLQTSPIQQSIVTATLLTLFTLISFIPLWLFGITIVIIIAWSVFT